MRINDIVNLLLPPQPLSRVRSAGASTGDTAGSLARALLALTELAAPGEGTSATRSRADTAAFSPAALTRSRAASAELTPEVAQDTQVEVSGDTSGPDLGGIVETYVRRRAILTYTLPSVGPSGASISLTFDVEGAQHTTRFYGPAGQRVNTLA